MKSPRKIPSESKAVIFDVWKMATKIPREIGVLENRKNPPLLTKCIEEKLNTLAQRRDLLPPNLQSHNSSIFIFSDYGGEHPDSKYNVFSFLICAYDPLFYFKESQDALRAEHKLNDPTKEFAFKNIGHGPHDRALSPYLNNLNNLVPGLLVSVVIEKNISIWGTNKIESQKQITSLLANAGLGDWKPKIAEKLVTIVHLASYFTALLANEGQKIYWQSDHDAIMANEQMTKNAGSLFTSTLAYYTGKKFPLIGYGKSFGKENPFSLDLLSAPDLVAGSIEHYLKRDNDLAKLTIKQKADDILSWHAHQGILLKKYAFIFRSIDGKLNTGTLKFDVKVPPTDGYFWRSSINA